MSLHEKATERIFIRKRFSLESCSCGNSEIRKQCEFHDFHAALRCSSDIGTFQAVQFKLNVILDSENSLNNKSYPADLISFFKKSCYEWKSSGSEIF